MLKSRKFTKTKSKIKKKRTNTLSQTFEGCDKNLQKHFINIR